MLDDFLARLIKAYWQGVALSVRKPAAGSPLPAMAPDTLTIVDLDLANQWPAGFAGKLMEHAATGHSIIAIGRNGGKMAHELHKAGCIVVDRPSVKSFTSILDAVSAGTYAPVPDPAMDITAAKKNVFADSAFTRRETEVLGWIARGFRNRQIAVELGIKEATVRTYIESIFGKTGIRSKHRLVIELSRHAALAVSPS